MIRNVNDKKDDLVSKPQEQLHRWEVRGGYQVPV